MSYDFGNEATPKGQIEDYLNEIVGLAYQIRNMVKADYPEAPTHANPRVMIPEIADNQFAALLIEVRGSRKHVRLVEERYATGGDSQDVSADNRRANTEILAWIKENPRHVERLDSLAATLNTSMNMREYKEALNDMFVVLGRPDIRPFYVSPAESQLPKSVFVAHPITPPERVYLHIMPVYPEEHFALGG